MNTSQIQFLIIPKHPNNPGSDIRFWRSDQFFNIEMARYSLSNHSFPRHFHNYYVIELVLSGADRFYCAGTDYTASAGQVVVINPGEVHTGSTMQGIGLQYYSMYPEANMLQSIIDILELRSTSGTEFNQTLLTNPVIAHQLAALFSALEKDDNTRDPDGLREEELFFQGMYTLLSQSSSSGSKPAFPKEKDKRITIVIDYMRTHFRSNISLQQLAALICVNPYHLIRIFKSEKGISPYEYLVNLRIEYARTLLRKNYPVAETATKAGFYDASHFNRLFRKLTGTSPKYFRPS